MQQPRNRKRKNMPQVHSPFQKKKHKGLVIALVAVLVLIAGVLLAAFLGWVNIPGITPSQDPDAPTADSAPDTVIHLICGGDLNVTDKSVAAGQTGSGYDYTNVFLDVAPVLSAGDLTALNLEGTLCGEPYGSQYASAPQELAIALKNAGVDLVQTANSRTISGGVLGLGTTLSTLRSVGLEPLGSYTDSAEFKKYGGYTIREVGGIRIALVAFTKGMDGQGLPGGSEDCVNLLYTDYSSTYQKVDKEGITKVLKAAAAQKPDITVALLHWGSEFNDKISTSQEEICTLMQQQGVDAIIGTHSHYVQKMTLDEETGQFVAYSLGDFFGDGDKTGTNYSVLLDLTVTKDGDTGETKVTAFDYTPIFIDHSETGSRVLRIREAMAAFESSSIGRVSQETYDAMASALKSIDKRITGK